MRSSVGLILLAVVACACALPAPTTPPTPSPAAPPSPSSPDGNPVPTSPPQAGFYLRAWYERALPPIHTFGALPVLTIADGVAIDGNVAIPAIYPGPLLILPFARSISDPGEAAIVDEARRLGLLSDATDFTGGQVAPGAQVARLVIVVDGITYDLSGRPDHAMGCGGRPCQGEPGTPEAFTTFWQQLSMLDAWLGGELGPQDQYQPERLAVLFIPPARPEPGLQPQLSAWPLAGSFEDVGVEFPGEEGTRCVTVRAADLEAVLPALVAANQLTVFHDSVDGQRSAVAVVVVPGAESPCRDGG